MRPEYGEGWLVLGALPLEPHDNRSAAGAVWEELKGSAVVVKVE